MTKAQLNPILVRLRGAIGDLVFKWYGDEVVVTRRPSFEGVEWSEAQQATRERFRRAAMYGKAVLADPPAEAFYREAAEARGKPFFSMMIADYLNEPEIERIDLDGYEGGVGDEIVVTAHDDLGVVDVTVRLAGADGSTLESGAAAESPPGSGRWVYRAQRPVEGTVQVTAIATDRPGGLARAQAEKAVQAHGRVSP
jgi:hypothetical protein